MVVHSTAMVVYDFLDENNVSISLSNPLHVLLVVIFFFFFFFLHVLLLLLLFSFLFSLLLN